MRETFTLCSLFNDILLPKTEFSLASFGLGLENDSKFPPGGVDLQMIIKARANV